MNNRIKELAAEAGAHFGYHEEHPVVFDTHTALAKFVQLIIAESVAVHEDHYGIDIIGDVLKNHFHIQ